MKALVKAGARVHLDRSRAEPVPRDGEATIRPTLVAVGRAEREVGAGLGAFEGVLGSDFVGVVEAIEGGGAELMGRRVVASPAAWCAACDLCMGGLREHCRAKTVLGRSGRDGCLADRFALPASGLVPVPDGLDDDRAVFTSLVASALQTRRQLIIEGAPYITVLGDGPLGLVVAQILQPLNASVRIVGRYSEKLALAERWGVKHRHVDDIGRRGDQDVVIDCTGTTSGFATAIELARARGTIVLKSRWLQGDARALPVNGAAVVERELRVIGSAGGPIAEAVTALHQEQVDVLSLIGARRGLDDESAMAELLRRPSTALRTLVSVG